VADAQDFWGGKKKRLRELGRELQKININTPPNPTQQLPSARSDTVLTYDLKGSKLIIFGGWANEWFNDVYMLDVGSVVGPPYAIMDMYPKLGPITGQTPIEITGIDFVNTTDVIVRFASKKNYIDVKGVYVSQTKITCVSPDCSKFPPGQVDVRVALNGDSFTTTLQPFQIFAVTDAAKCLMYGPGILSGCAVNEGEEETMENILKMQYSTHPHSRHTTQKPCSLYKPATRSTTTEPPAATSSPSSSSTSGAARRGRTLLSTELLFRTR